MRNKYNTLTLAEAKKLNKFLATNGRQPIRTASVMNKPRPPPIVVTTSIDSQSSLDLDITPTKQPRPQPQAEHQQKQQQPPQQHHRSESRASLASSTFKVFQSPYANFKRLFRNIHRPFSSADDSGREGNGEGEDVADRSIGGSVRVVKTRQQALEESISRICFDRSLSPPICPPPPGELKSMSYMESSINYSNYDDFTRSRNEQFNHWESTRLSSSRHDLNDNRKQQQQQNFDGYSIATIQHQELEYSDSWQLNSLPVSYERNLTILPEDKRISTNNEFFKVHGRDRDVVINPSTYNENQLIKPPKKFEDEVYQQPRRQQDSCINQIADYHMQPKTSAKTSSNQSLASTTTADSVLDYHRQTATKYRFSFAQPTPLPDEVNYNKDIGLPPRMPLTTASETKQPDTSSGNSSTNSSQINGSNECDRKITSFETSDKFSLSDDSTGYGNIREIENDNDTTILSETSTLLGDANAISVGKCNRCLEYQRSIELFRNKLISKEKELTDSHLAQLHSDYEKDGLKRENAQYKRENAQLKALIAKYNLPLPSHIGRVNL